ncbi:MAG: LysR substrate-binding domain-containing protein [Alphaproteobacteria bacterium]
MDLRQLRYFVGIVEAGSVSRAAAHLHVAQSALSQHLARLEVELGTALILRGQNGATPTPAGQTLYRHACGILRQVEAARDDTMSTEAALAGDVAVGLPSVLSPMLSYRLFMAVRDRHPGIRLRLLDGHSPHLRELLESRRLDLSLLFLAPPEKGLTVEVLVREELFFLSADLDRTSIAIEDLAAQPLLLPSLQSGIIRALEAEFRKRGLALQTLGEMDSLSAVKQAAAAGIAGTVLPWSSLYGEELADSLSVARIEGVSLVRPVALCAPVLSQPSLAMLAVAAILTEIMRGLVTDRKWKGASLPD